MSKLALFAFTASPPQIACLYKTDFIEEPTERRFKMKEQRKNILWMIISMVLLGQLTVGVAMGDLITITDAKQQVGSGIGYTVDNVDYLVTEVLDPTSPQGIGNANLSVSILESGYSASGNASLISTFAADQVTANGSTEVSAEWLSPPIGADDIHVGAGSSFIMTFVTGASPVFFDIDGAIAIGLVNYPSLHPDETFAYMRLSSTSGPVLWEEQLVGTDALTSIVISHSDLLSCGQEYLFEAYAESGTVAECGVSEGFKSRNASFNFTNTVAIVPAPGAILLGSIGLSLAGLKLRRRREV